MDKKLVKAINAQINKEFYSAYLYLAMAAYADAKNLSGIAHWLKVQAKEETEHGMKFYEFLNDRGENVVLEAIAQPTGNFKSIRDIFIKTLEHEQKVTASINNLYVIAKNIEDSAAEVLLHWFITEQVEEEKNAMDILAKLDYLKEDSPSIILLDKELGGRKDD